MGNKRNMANARMALLAGMCAAAAAGSAGERPNIVYIMCDDMGYGDLSCYGQQRYSTPNIDRLAAQGMLFTQAYAGSPVSAPSRATLMTGQHTGHTHVRGNREYWPGTPKVRYGVVEEYARTGQEPYDTRHKILPEIFKANGYSTALFGKWAGGYEGSASTPDKRGVDEFYGFICQYMAHLYFPNFLNKYSRASGDTAVSRVVMEQNVQHPMYGVGYSGRRQYSSEMIHRKALEWLGGREKGEPFIAFLTYTLPHAELRQPEDSLLEAHRARFCNERGYAGDGDRYNPAAEPHAQFAAMVARLDSQVGDVLRLLDEKGLADNTIVVFTSDNGPHEEGGADPSFFNRDAKLRGLKRSTYEGGIRVPFIVRWPGRVAPGGKSGHMFAFYDMAPTLCEAAGISDFPSAYVNPELPGDGFDGISILPTLTGEGEQAAHGHLYWEFHETDMIGVRWGDMKMVVEKGVPRLYDLSADPHEDRDIAADNPGIVARMVDMVYADHRDSQMFKVTLPAKEGAVADFHK